MDTFIFLVCTSYLLKHMYVLHDHVSSTVFEMQEIFIAVTKLIKQFAYNCIQNILFHFVLKIKVYIYSAMHSTAL